MPQQIPPTCQVIFAHDHTYASYRFVLAGVRARGGVLDGVFRLAIPCCDAGCPELYTHAKCSAQPRLTVDAHPPVPFPAVQITPEWLACVDASMRATYEAVHERRDSVLGGETLARKELRGAASRDDAAVRLALAHRIPVDEIVLPTEPYYPDLPMGLVDGPIPFEPRCVAQYVRGLLLGNRIELVPPPGFELNHSTGEWIHVVRPSSPGEVVVREIPRWCVASRDFPGVVDTGTWFSPAYALPPGHADLRSAPRKWRVTFQDGMEFHDPVRYVTEWIRAALTDIETRDMRRSELVKKQNVFLRTIYVSSKFQDQYGNYKREYVDETKKQKMARIARTFGPEFVEPLMALPIGMLGPDFELPDDWNEDQEEEEEEEDDEDDPGVPKKRYRPLTAREELVARLDRIIFATAGSGRA